VLSDTDRIRNLLGRYCELIDSGDLDGVGALFARGILADEHGQPFAQGAEEVAGFYGRSMQMYAGRPGTKHMVSNTVFDEPDSDGTVTAHSSYVVFQATDALPLQPMAAGRYQDRFGRERDGRWHFVERRFLIDLVGDMSHHWSGPGA